MNLYLANPFTEFGKMVSGSSFIGRQEDLKAIESRVIHPLDKGGSLAIVGLPRIGKSSLVYQALIEPKLELYKRKLVPIRINLGLYKYPESFFPDLVFFCKEVLEELQWENDIMRVSANKALKKDLEWTERINRIERFFTKVHQAGIRVIFVLDEFDHARTLFSNSTEAIQFIRDLAYSPEYGISWVVTSRRPIDDIEAKTAISTLAGILPCHYLSVFNEKEDLPAYFDRFAKAGLTITEEHKEVIDSYCGRHPYLLAMLGYHLVNMYAHRPVDIDVKAAFQKVEQQFVVHYDDLIKKLREDDDKRFKKLLQILFGPIYGLKQTDINEMINYGLIRPNPAAASEGNGTVASDQNNVPAYIAFSHHFQEYLRVHMQWGDLWPLLGETEKALRRVIRLKLPEKYGNGTSEYGEHCLDAMRQARPKLTGVFQQCEKNRNEDKNGLAPSTDLLDYTYPRDLFSIIFAEWDDLFKSIFGKHQKKNKDYWNTNAEKLTKIRNPLAHHRIETLSTLLYSEAERICNEIIAIVKTVEETPLS